MSVFFRVLYFDFNNKYTRMQPAYKDISNTVLKVGGWGNSVHIAFYLE